jgi:hypothetical protein
LDAAALIAGLVLRLFLEVSVVAANWDMKTGNGILIKLNVRLKYAASETNN